MFGISMDARITSNNIRYTLRVLCSVSSFIEVGTFGIFNKKF